MRHRGPALITSATLSLGLLLVGLPGPAVGAGARAMAGSGSASAVAAHHPSAVPAATRSMVSTAVANTRISRVLASRTTSPILGSRFTMTVWDTAAARYVYRKRATASLRGASTTKILTSVGVLANLGPDHRFATTVRAGSTSGEIVLVGGGDPLLTSANLRMLARSTAGALPAGAVTVRADDSLFSSEGAARGWASGWVPSQVRPVGAFARDDRAIRDATADAGTYFASALRALGVRATYAGEALAEPGADTLATFSGHSVGEAVRHALMVSDNDTAEMLFRHIAVARGLPATWAGARKAQAATLAELRIPLDGVRIIDGSGLSLDGRLTAYALTSALNRALSPDHPELARLRQWLPVAGRTGTLRASNKRFTTWPSRCAAGQIQAKTGTVADAIALAGYASGADGRTKIFVSIVNGRPTRYSRLTTRRAVDKAASSVTGCW